MKKTVKKSTCTRHTVTKDLLARQVLENERQIKDLELSLETADQDLLKLHQANINLRLDLDQKEKDLIMMTKKAERLVDTLHRQDDAYMALVEDYQKMEAKAAEKFTLGEVLGFVLLTITTFIMVLINVA